LSDLDAKISAVPGLTSSAAISGVLGTHVYDIAVIFKSILESKTFPHHSTAKNLLQPFVDILQKAMEFALIEKRDHLKTCFVQDKDVDKDRQFCEEGGTISDNTRMQLCVLCSHGNVDFPASNAPNQATNNQNCQQYETELASRIQSR
jgi:hypothetical protein